MQKYIFILSVFIVLLFNSCGEKANQASAVANAPEVKQVQKMVKPALSNQAGIQISISSVDAQKGEEVCVSFLASDFDNIMAYQHSINFDPEQLAYVSTKNYGLPHLSDANFGATKASDGDINFLWYDMNVKGISVADQTKVFDLCFKALADKGSACTIKISEKPIKIEVVGPQKQKLKLSSSVGVINVK